MPGMALAALFFACASGAVAGQDEGGSASVPALVELSRGHYLAAEAEKDKGIKLARLEKSISAADRALKKDPDAPRPLYWRSMALLLKAELTGGLKALGMVKDALRGLEKVSRAEPLYDDAGALRGRGKVLIDAPRWAFIGDRKEGLKLLEKAKSLAPDNLTNRLYLAQAYMKNGMRGAALREAQSIISAPVDEMRAEDDALAKREAHKILQGGE
ncbi:MAG TPA: hypothetical protein VJM83_01270 [Nitrospirota bacterium]|nr:hypothetical protein [Nitrospirota bacterium]